MGTVEALIEAHWARNQSASCSRDKERTGQFLPGLPHLAEILFNTQRLSVSVDRVCIMNKTIRCVRDLSLNQKI